MRVRELTIRQLNRIANDDAVLPFIAPGADGVDLSWVEDKDALILGCDGVDGAVLLFPENLGTYDVHWLMPGYGGTKAVKAIIDWMFTHTNAQAIFGATPRSNLAARSVNRWLGALPVRERIDAAGRPCVVYELTRERWASLITS